MLKILSTFVISLLLFNSVFGQQKTQINPIPRSISNVNFRVGCSLFSDPNNFSTGSSFSYNAPINNNSNLTTGSGTNLGCMYSVPNQAWFIITVNTGGNLYFNISNSNNYDIDAVIWGPISGNDVSNACNSTQNYPTTCDWDAGRPDLYLSGAQAGQKYVMLVTNYSNANTVINIAQPTGGSVTFSMVNLPNCSLVPSATITGTSTTVNEGQSAALSLNFTGSSPWEYSLSDGSTGTTYSSPVNINVFPSASQTYTINSVSNLCGTSGGSGSVGVSVVRNVQLKSCFPLDGNISDSQTLNTGSLQNGVLPTTNRSSEANKALLFDGLDDYVSFTTNQLNNNTFAFSAWTKLDELPTVSNSENIILSLGSSSDEHFLGVEFINGNPAWKFSSNNSSIYSSAVVDLNWHHIVGVRTGGKINIYIDGVLSGSTSVSGLPTFGSSLSGRLGSGISNNKYFKGKIDDIKIFNGSLIEPEVLLLQNYNTCNNVYNDTFISVQSVSTSVICSGASFVLRAFTNNILPDGQLQFTAELSDATGSFASPTVIGSSAFLPLTVTVPSNIAGGNYKVRVRYGGIVSVNSFDIYVNNPATYNINGTVVLNDGQSSNLTLNFTGTGPWNYIMNNGLSGVATTSPWLITVSPDQSTTYSISSAQNVCGNASINGSSLATVTINYTKQFVSCFPFNANAIDSKGNNTSTVNGPILSENRYGQTNASYSYNGTNNYIEYTTNLLRKREFTMSAWVLVNSIPSSAQYILSQGETGTNTFQGIGVNSSGWFFQSYSNSGQSFISNSTAFAANQWVQITAVRSYQSLKLYINGNLVTSTSNNSIIPFKTSDIGRIGANSSILSGYFNGKIDDVRLFKGALNDEEVFALFANTTDCPIVENAPIIVARSISPSTVCAGNPISIVYTTSNVTVNSGNPITVQLSDASGLFGNPLTVGSGFSSPIQATIPAATVNSNFYRVRLVSSGNVLSVNNLSFVVSGSLPVATISGGGSIPFGGTSSVTINFTGTAPYTFALNNGSNQNAAASPAVIPVSPYGTTIYSVTSVSNSCGSGSGLGTATVNVAPNIALGSIASIFCQGQTFSVPFTANFTATPNFRVELSDAAGSFSSPVNIGTGNAGSISVTIPNNTLGGSNYKIRIVSDSPVYASPEFQNITINTKATATISGTTTINEGESTSLTLNFTGTAPYTYAINNGASQSTAVSPTIVSVSPTVQTNYSITSLSNYCGSGTFSGTSTISIAPKITLGTIGGIYCQGQTFLVPFTANFTPTPNFRVELSDAAGSFSSPVNIGTGNAGSISVTIPNNTLGGSNYKIRIVSDSPAYASPEFQNITINTKATATISGTTTINEGESTNLTLNFTGTAPYTYLITDGVSQNTSLSSITIPVFPIINKTYTITTISNSCGAGIGSGSAIITVTPVPIRLVSCFPFNGNANDSKGLNNGTVYGATLTTDRFGNPNSAYSFDGVDDKIETSVLGYGNNNYSISVWFNRNINSNEARTIYYLGNPNTPENMIYTDNSTIVFISGPGGNYYQSNLVYDNQWNHAVLVRDGMRIKTYLNGNFIGQSSIDNTFSPADMILSYIGANGRPSYPSGFFKGKIDDFQIYKGALSPEQVAYIYNSNSPCIDPTIIPFLTLNTIPGTSFCQNQTFTVPFSSVNISPTLGNPINVELSDANGSFSSPIIIGTSTSVSGIITALIPIAQTTGNGYKIRLKQGTTISNLSSIISINAPVIGSISGTSTINEGELANLTLSFSGTSPYSYTINAGSSQTTNLNTITFPVYPIVNTTYQITSLSNSCGNSTGSGSAVITVTPVAIRLVSCFPFNGNANDSKGVNNGTVYGATLTTDRFNNLNSAYFFNKYNSNKIQSTAINLSNNEFTISVWAKITLFPTISSEEYTILDLGSDSNLAKMILSFSFSNNIPKWTFTNVGLNYIEVVNVPDVSNWNNLVIVKNLFGIFFYINGVLKNSVLQNFTPNFGTNANLKIGSQNSLIGNPISSFHGNIDDFQIYKGALTSGQVQALYQNTNACFDATTYVCISNAVLNSILNGQQVIKAGNSINANNIIGTSSNIHFDSKNSIMLEPGFSTGSNSIFKATVGGGCEN